MKLRMFAVVLCLVLVGVFAVPNAMASNGNEEIIFKVNKGPLELPGHVLEPGKYDMKFTNLEHDQVLVESANGEHPVGFFLVVPTTRNRITNNPKLEIAEPMKGAVARLDGFFYPDRKTGYDFIYPQTTVTAKVPHS